ncbi:MAG: extracellular solute-binding protein [Candidatus Omnitrophica bacterium]|nr:extracellular solute-binding protein [Candidatus Omnitrophota bacterium]
MKKYYVILLLILAMVHPLDKALCQESNSGLKGRITISGAWALYPMAVKWAEEFQKVYPGIKIDVSAGGAGKGMADCLAKVVDLGMVSREINPEEIKKGAWAVAVVIDAVVATANSNNPRLASLLSTGITKKSFSDIFMSGTINTWGELINKEDKSTLNVYTRSDSCGAAETWAKYLGGKQEDLIGIGVYGDPGVAEAVKKDLLGIGYNNINFAYDLNSQKQIDGIAVLPIDINSNGKIDKDENFYDNVRTITSAIADGKYPSPPARELYFVSNGRPENNLVRLFLRWAITDGQKFVAENGYMKVSDQTVYEDLDKIGND